jgi:uncharacterized protein YciI
MIFAVTRRSGSAWDDGRGLREQDGWDEHAAFMDALAAEGFVLLAGPLAGARFHRALMVVRADSEDRVHARLAADPWTGSMLETVAVEPWQVLLGDPAAAAHPPGQLPSG